MILRKNLPVGGTLITIVILLFCECHTISGQDETAGDFSSFSTSSHTDDIIEDEPCPCILKLECPRVYGSNPLDFTEIGQVEPCKKEGYVRCCGIAVTVVQAQDTRYEESSTWEFSDSDAVKTSPHEESSEKEDDAESLNHSDSSNLHSPQGQNDNEKDIDDGNHESTQEHDDQGNSEEKKIMIDENEDLTALPSNQDSYKVIVQPPGDSSKRKFRPKFPRYQRPEKIATWTELGSNDGNNSNEKHVSEEEQKIKSSDNNPNNGNEGSGSVVYSQRVPEFSPYRRRNPSSSTAPVYTITPIDSPNDSGKEASDDSAGAITANRGDRPKYQMRRRKPFKQMRNRAQQQEQEENINGKDGSEIKTSEGETKDSVEIDGLSTPSSSLDSSSPASLPVTTATEASSSEEITNGLDNQKRPMSRLGRPKVNGLFGRNPIGSIETSPIMSAEQNGNLESNALTSTLNNDEIQDNREVLKEKEILENGSTTDDSSAGITGSTSESSEIHENSPTGNLMPIRPKIRPFPLIRNSTDAVNIDVDTVVSQEENRDEAVNSPVSDADDTGKPTEPLHPKRNRLYQRKVLVRRVRPNSSTVPSETDEGSSNVATEDAENIPVPTASRTSRGNVIIRRIRPVSSGSLQIKDVNAEELSSAPSLQAEGQDEYKETPNPPVSPKEEKLDIRSKLLGRKRNHPLKETTSDLESSPEVEKVENPEEPVKPSESESNRPNILKRRRLLRKPTGQGQTESSDNNNSSEIDTKSTEDSSVAVEEVPELPVPAEKSPIKIRKGVGRLRKPPKNTEKEETGKPENSSESESASVTSAVETDKPFLLRQRNRMSASTRSKGKNPLLPSSTESTAPAEESHTSEAPVTVTSTYSRIRVNNKQGLLSRPSYRKTVKPSYPAESEKNSVAAKETSQTDTPNVNRVSKYEIRTRTRVPSTVPPQKSEETTSSPLPESEEKPIGSNDDLEKQGQLSQLVESSGENSGQAQDPPKRRRFGQRKRVRVNKPLAVDQQETEQEQQKHQQQEEKVEDNNQNGESGNDVNPTEENSEHATSSVETVTTEHYPNSDILLGNDEVIQKQGQSEDQSSPSVYSSSVPDAKYNLERTNKVSVEEEHVGIVQNPISSSSGSEDYHQKHYLGSSLSTSNMGHDGIKPDDDNNDNYDDSKYKKVFSYHPEGSRRGEIEPYDLILNQDVRKQLGTQGTHHLKPHEASADVSSAAYQVYAQNPQTLDHKQAYQENRNHASLPHHSTYLLDRDERPQQQQYYTSQQYNPQNYEQDYYDSYSADNYESQNSDDEIDKYSGEVVGHGNGYNRYHEPVIPTYAHQFSADDDGTGGFETIEFGTPDYDPTPYNSWYSYGEGQENEEESRVSVKFLKDKSRKNGSSQVLGNPKDQSIRGNGSNNNSNNKNDNEGSRVNNSQVKVGPPRVTHRTVNRMNVSNSQENGKDRTHSLTHENRGTESIRKDANASIRQKLRRPPSAYITNSSKSHVERVPTTAAPFSPSLQSPRPSYSGKEAVLESVNQSVQSLSKAQEPSSSTSKSTSYPNSGQSDTFIENQQRQQINPPERKNRTRPRVKLVTFRTTTPTPAPLPSTYANSNDHYSFDENEKNVVAPDVPSSSSPQRPLSSPSSGYSSFTFPPFKKSELTLIPTSTETPLEDYVSHASTDSNTSVPSLRKPQRNSYSSQHNNQASSSSSNELPKTSSEVNRHVPKPSIKGRFKVPQKNITNILVTSERPTPQPHESSSSSFDSQTTKRPQPRIKSSLHIRKSSTIPTTEQPIRHQIPETSTATQPYYVNHGEQDVDLVQEKTTPLSYGTFSSSLVLEPSSRPQHITLAPENSPEPISIRIQSQHEDLNKYNDVNNDKYVNEFSAYVTPESNVRESSPSPNSIHSPPFSHSFPKVSGKESYASLSDSKSSTQKGKYTRFKVPEKFELPHIEESTSFPTTSNDNYVPKEHRDQQISTFSYESENAQVSEEPFQTQLPHFPTPTRMQSHSQYSHEHTLNQNPNHYNQQHSSYDEDFQNLALPQKNTFDDEQLNNVQREPEIIPDIRINVLPPPVFNSLQEERTTPKPLFLATREPEHIFDTPPQQLQPFTLSNALSNSPYGPFPSTDHWSGIPTANSPRLPEYFEQNKGQPQTVPPPPQNSHVIFEQNQGTNLPPPSPGHTPSVSFEQSREQPQLFSPQPNSNTMFEQNKGLPQLSSPPRPTSNVMFEQAREPPQPPSYSQPNAMFEQSREPSELPPPLRPNSNVIFEQNREPPHLPPPLRPTSNVMFEQAREPPQLPSHSQPNAMFEQSREPSELPPPLRPNSNVIFEQNRGPHHPPPPQPHTSNVIFEQNAEFPQQRPHLFNGMQPRPHTQMLHPRPENPVRFEEGNDEEEFVRRPLSPYHSASIKFGTAHSGNDEEEEEPTKPEIPFRQQHAQTNSNNFELPGSQMNHFGGNPDAPLQFLSPRPPAQSPTGFRDRPVQLPLEVELPPLKHMPNPLANDEIIEQHSPTPHGNHNGMEIHNQHRPSNEAQLPIIQHQLPSQEPVPHGVPHNPVPIRTVSYEIREGELQPPNREIPDGSNEIRKPPVNFPQNLRQQEQRHHQFPIQQQQNMNLHLPDLPMNSQQPSHPPQMQQRPQVINHFPKDVKVENSLHSEGNIHNNVHLPNPNMLVQIDGRPHGATPINLGNNMQKPNDRPGGHVFFEKEPGLNVQSQPAHPHHPPAPLRVNNVKLESHNHQGPNIREPVTTKPMHFPQPPQIKFPEGNLPGFAERPPSRPGQFGPPPPSQQSLPQYVPFSSNGERPKMNESDRPVQVPVHNRPPYMPHTSHSNPGKFRGPQSPPQYNQHNLRPQAQPPRQHGYMGQPTQSFSPNRRPPPPQMMMPGFNKGQYGNNQLYHQQQQRLRNPYSRTSRAANLTAEEEKANANEPLLSLSSSNDEQESFSDQQAILFVQTPQESSNRQAQTLTSEGSTEREEHQVEHKENADVSQFTPEIRHEDVISTSDASHRLTPLEKKNWDSISESEDDSPLSNKQQRELNIAGISRSQQEQRDDAFLIMPTDLDDGDDLVAEESVKVEKTQLPRDKVESGNGEEISFSHPSPSLIHSPGLNKKVEEAKGNEEVLQPPEMKNKDKSEISLKAEEKERSNPFVSKSSENKKDYIKGKNMNANFNSQDKNEDIHQQNYRKMKGKGIGEKEQEKEHHHQQPDKTSSINPDETQEQQEFVAPTQIQRGFFPILPYSEKDPGPIVVQMQPKIEKFLPPQQSPTIMHNPNINSESVGAHSFQILPSTQQIKSKPITTSPSSSIPSSSLGHADDSKALFLSNQLNNNNQLAVLQSNTLENNQTPFTTMTSNYLTV